MKKALTKTQLAMRQLGSIGGKANVKKHGKGWMKKISNDFRKKERSKKKIIKKSIKQT